MTLAQLALINLGALITAAGGIALKRFSENLPDDASVIRISLYSISSPNFWVAVLCYTLPIILWAYLLKQMELSKLQPMLSIVYVYSLVMAAHLLDEQINSARIVGVALIVAGVVVVGRS